MHVSMWLDKFSSTVESSNSFWNTPVDTACDESISFILTYAKKKILSRRYDDLVSLETPVPHYDGRQWRKYGQKHINKAKHPRYLFYFFVVNLLTPTLHIHLYVLWLSVCVNGKQQICTTVSTWTLIIWFSRSYYRCTYKQEQDCKATKTVQQQDDSTGTDHPVMYTVIYHGQHTCKDNNGVESGTDDSETNDESSSDSRSSISTTCTEAYEHQTSVDDNKPLDKSADLSTRNCMYEPFDMAAFAPLDLDNWELDALLRFGA
jgi:hypothetical protein